MRLRFGPLSVTLAKTYQHGNSLYFQRHIPADLRGRYPARIIKKSLKTLDPVKAAKLAEALERHYDTEFQALRAAPESSPRVLDVHAEAFLREWGLAPLPPGTHPRASDNDPMAVELLAGYLDDKRERHAEGSDEVYREAHAREFLSPVELRAWQRLQAAPEDTLTTIEKVYVDFRRNLTHLEQ